MTDLSPAAQAILKAAYEATRNPNWQTNFYTSYAAAALRAAADQVLVAEWEGQIPPDTTHSLGINWSRDALHAIAAELEDFE
jgi:post-segregation antitoxin (ccd killing protein)